MTVVSSCPGNDYEDEARAIIRLMLDRAEEERVRSGRSTLPALRMALLGLRSRNPDYGRYTVPSPRMRWVLSVGCMLNILGPEAAFIMVARLGRRQKSSENSWSRILAEMEDRGMTQTREQAEAILRRAVPIFLLLLEKNGIGRDYRETIAA